MLGPELTPSSGLRPSGLGFWDRNLFITASMKSTSPFSSPSPPSSTAFP